MKATPLIGACAATLLLASLASAQLLPHQRTFDIMVGDSGNDLLVRLADFNQDGSYNQAGEWLLYYDTPTTGGPLLTNPSTLAFDGRGYLYAADTTTDVILRMIDKNGDGAATQSGEWNVYIDCNNNGSGVIIGSIQKIIFDDQNVMWGVNASSGTTNPLDCVFRAEDLNADGDCNDPGEITVPYDSAIGPFNIATPFAIARNPKLPVFYVIDVNPDVMYGMMDTNFDGDFYDAGETFIAYTGTLPGQPGLSNGNTICFGPKGDLFLNDSSLDQIVKLTDINNDLDFDDPGESVIWADKSGWGGVTYNEPYNHFHMEVDENGRIFATENSTPGDLVVMYEDLNQDGDAQDPNELKIVYDSTLAAGPVGSPRSLALVPAPTLFTPSSTVKVGQSLSLEFHGAANDQYQLLVGLNSLGVNHPLPPYGYLTQDFFLLSAPLNLDLNGFAGWTIPVPVTLPTPFTAHFTQIAGKLPYRYYLSNPVTVTFVP